MIVKMADKILVHKRRRYGAHIGIRNRRRPRASNCIVCAIFGDASWITNICRLFRDKVLRRVALGRKFIEIYYGLEGD